MLSERRGEGAESLSVPVFRPFVRPETGAER
jgi:hypothetical protein